MLLFCIQYYSYNTSKFYYIYGIISEHWLQITFICRSIFFSTKVSSSFLHENYLRCCRVQFLDYSHFAYSVIYLCIYVLPLDQIKSLCVILSEIFSRASYAGECVAYLLRDTIGVVLFLYSCNIHMYNARMYVTHTCVCTWDKINLTGYRYNVLYSYWCIVCVIVVDVVNRRVAVKERKMVALAYNRH